MNRVIIITAVIMSLGISASSAGRFGSFQGRNNISPPMETGMKATFPSQTVMKVKGGPELWGVIEYAKSWNELPENEERPYGVYSFLASNPTSLTQKLKLGANTPNGGGVIVGNEFRFINYTVMYETQVVSYYYRYDIDTWQPIGYPQYGMDASVIATDLAYDPTTENVYGYFYNPLDMDAAMNFGIITYGEYGVSVQNIAPETDDMICLTVGDDGILYALSDEGAFYTVDKNTGQKSLVDYTGVRPSTFRQSMAYDARSGKIYWTAFVQTDQEEFTSMLYEINPESGIATKLGEFDDAQEITCLYIPVPEADDDAPAAPENLAVDFTGGELSGTATFVMPAETYGGAELSGDLSYEIFANGIPVARGSAPAASEVNAPVSVSEGMTEFYVVASNAAGVGAPSEKVSRFVGFDTPAEPLNVTIDFNRETGKVSLEWEEPESTVNGGYLDLPNIRYDVTRYPGGVKVAENTFLNIFSETLTTDELASYYYTVCAVNHGKAGGEAVSGKVIVGEAFNIPFADDFSSGDFSLYDVVDVADDGVKWNDAINCFSIFYHWTNPLDDWLFTPPVRLEAGVTYSFTVGLRGGSSYDEESFEIGFGNGIDPASYTVILDETKVNSSNYARFRCSVTPDASGIYRFGIHATSAPYKGGMYVNYVSVDTEFIAGSPEQCANLQVTPDTDGGNTACISFNAPDKTRDGNTLTAISRIDILRGSLVVNSIQNPQPGSAQSFTDTDMPYGLTEYSVVAYNDAGKGGVARTQAYIGIDVPVAVSGVKLSQTADNHLHLSWDATAASGVNGGYVDTDNVVYTIYEADGTEVDRIIGQTSWENTGCDTGNRSNVIYYKVTASSAAGESEAAESNYFVIGSSLMLPLKESFAGSKTNSGLWWTNGLLSFNAFSFSGESSDHDDGSMKWFAVNDGDWASLSTGRLKAGNAHRLMLFFDYRYNPGTSMKLSVMADPCQQGDVTLATFDAEADTDNSREWRKAVIEVPADVAGAEYFVLRFKAEADRYMLPGYEPNTIFIDNIELRDVSDNDVTVRLESPATAKCGETITARVYIDNRGFNPVEDMTVALLADGETADSRTINIPFNGSAEILLDFTAPLKEGEVVLATTANLEGDADNDDNTDELTVTITDPQLPGVTDLRASGTDDVTLTWSEPRDLRRRMTETFDSYTPWMYEGVGGWTMFDGDGVETNVYSGMHYPNIGEKLAWIVFNNDYAQMYASQREIFTPASGNQCMLAVANVHEYGKGILCDDWLITPRLSGEEHKIEFDIKSLTDYEEDFAIYVTSSETADVTEMRASRLAFEKFGAGNQWRHYEYTIPEGTTYAALVYTSNLSGVMVDNFIFETPSMPVKGYVVYRDGTEIATLSADKRTFVDTGAVGNKGVYTVTVVYDDGHSGHSNEACAALGGIDTITVTDDNDMIYTPDGIFRGRGTEAFEKLPAGIYIVGGRKTVKR